MVYDPIVEYNLRIINLILFMVGACNKILNIKYNMPE